MDFWYHFIWKTDDTHSFFPGCERKNEHLPSRRRPFWILRKMAASYRPQLVCDGFWNHHAHTYHHANFKKLGTKCTIHMNSPSATIIVYYIIHPRLHAPRSCLGQRRYHKPRSGLSLGFWVLAKDITCIFSLGVANRLISMQVVSLLWDSNFADGTGPIIHGSSANLSPN